MKRALFQQTALRLAALSLAAGLAACAAPAEEDDEPVGDIAQAATAYKLDGKYYYRTDHFSESCSAATLSVQTSWAPTFTPVLRGDVTYLKPSQGSNDSFEWHCGNVLINGHDHSECDGGKADWVRFYWSPNSSNIDVQCFKRCGDGSSASDCIPY
jgi:hypothetical protein